MNKVTEIYNYLIANPHANGPLGSIVEHLPTLKELASESNFVVEMGVGMIISTWALLAGNPKKLISYDINHPKIHGANIDSVYAICKEANIHFEFIQADTASIEIEECDFLFIDSLHTYDHLKKELYLHAKKVKKYIAFHDTVTFGERGELPNSGGLMPAILEFLDLNPDWEIKEHYLNNNGLLVLKKKTYPI